MAKECLCGTYNLAPKLPAWADREGWIHTAKGCGPGPERKADEPRVNAYGCPTCGSVYVTIDRDKGVTPFLLRCGAHGQPTVGEGGCSDMARSSFYRPPPGLPSPSLEWYRPTLEEATAAGSGMASHAAKGGLFIRQIPKAKRSPV